jgi:hypothetical protein
MSCGDVPHFLFGKAVMTSFVPYLSFQSTVFSSEAILKHPVFQYITFSLFYEAEKALCRDNVHLPLCDLLSATEPLSSFKMKFVWLLFTKHCPANTNFQKIDPLRAILYLWRKRVLSVILIGLDKINCR